MAPPKKRARTTIASQTPNQDTPPPFSPPPRIARSTALDSPTHSQYPTALDRWTPSQTTSLFKAIIRSKPTGIHRHIHMLSILQSVHDDYNTTSHTSGPVSPGRLPLHLRREGIWKKLESLYDLAALDEREDTYRRSGPQFRRGRDGVAREVVSGSDDEGSDQMEGAEKRPFSLLGQDDVDEKWDGIHDALCSSHDQAERELAHMMWSRRLRDQTDHASESDDDELAEDPIIERGSHGAEIHYDNGDTKSRSRASRRASTRHAPASTPATSTPGADEVGDEEDEADTHDESRLESANSSPPATKLTRSSARTAIVRTTRRK